MTVTTNEQGGSFSSRVRSANQKAKKHKVVTKGSNVLASLGLDKQANKLSGGLYGDLVNLGKSRGYGRKQQVVIQAVKTKPKARKKAIKTKPKARKRAVIMTLKS